jgi:hypothetical protein
MAKASLLWVLHAQRPMTIEELRHAVAVSQETHRFQPARLVPDTPTLIGLCKGLLTVEGENETVGLVRK